MHRAMAQSFVSIMSVPHNAARTASLRKYWEILAAPSSSLHKNVRASLLAL